MKAKIINFPSKKELLKRNQTRKGNASVSRTSDAFKSFSKILSDRELAKRMFPPDYFMLVE